jgi:hypothetical protein
MAIYRKARALPILRLKSWDAGRIAQLKLFTAHLETAVNKALAAQVSQTPSRDFSEFVPIIPVQNIEGEVEYREIRIQITPPKGIKNFLFYEFDISESSNFFQFERFQSAEPFYVFTDLQDAAVYFIRIRVVTTKGQVGPWSETFEGTTPLAKSQHFKQDFEVSHTIKARLSDQPVWNNQIIVLPTVGGVPEPNWDDSVADEGWNDVYLFSFEGIGGVNYYSIEYEAQIVRGSSATFIHWVDAEFRWIRDTSFGSGITTSTQIGQNMPLTLFGADSSSSADFTTANVTGNVSIPQTNWATSRRGTFLQKFSALPEGNYTLRLQCRIMPGGIHPTPLDYTGEGVIYADDSSGDGPNLFIRLKFFNLFEVNPSASS